MTARRIILPNMPWIGLKGDCETPGAVRSDPAIPIDRVRCQAFEVEVRNTITANKAVATITISDPTIGKAT